MYRSLGDCLRDVLVYSMFFWNRMFDLLPESSTLFGDLLRCMVSVAVLSIGAFLSWRGSPDIPRTLFAPSPVYISVRKSKGSPSVERINLRDFVESKIPSLYLPFVPAWWLSNGHLQTIYSVLGDFSKVDNIVYHRKHLRLMDGGTLGLDFTPTNYGNLKPETPIIVVMHGLTGGSFASYVRAVLARSCAPVEQNGFGYRAVVINFRGCAGTPITTPQLYSACHTDDLRQSLFYLSAMFPKAPLLGVGYSLGANVLTRYLAEEGGNSRLVSGCVVNCPWDLKQNNEKLLSTFTGRYIYHRAMGKCMQNVIKRHAGALSKDPDTLMTKRVTAILAMKYPRGDEVDHIMMRFVGGTFPPFESAEAYYVCASSHKVLGDIRVPFLCINSADDPIVRTVPEDGAGNGYVVMSLTSGGGHLGWFEASDRLGEARSWIKKPVLEWLRTFGEDVVYEGQRGRPLHEVDGFLKEVGRDNIGCREVGDEAGYISGTRCQEGLLSGL